MGELVQQVSVSRNHGGFVEDHAYLLEEGDVPVRRGKQDDPASPQFLGNGLCSLEDSLVELGFQELGRVLELRLV